MSRLNTGTLRGLLLVALLGSAAYSLAQLPLFSTTLRLSPLILGILIGMVVANTVHHRIPKGWHSGLALASKQILRLAIVLYGFRLTLSDVAYAGWEALLIDILMVSSVLLLGWLVGRWLGLGDRLSLLCATGSAVCGAAAVLGAEPVLRARTDQTVIAVSTVVIFGTLLMFVYPVLYHSGLLGLSDHQMAIYTGATLHEVAHVAGAGAGMGGEIAGLATITKMIRVILLAPVLLVLSFCFKPADSDRGVGAAKIPFPWFAVYFVLAILANSGLDYLSQAQGWQELYTSGMSSMKVVDDFLLTMAMTAIGMDAQVARFKQAGWRPFLLALVLCLWLVGGGYLAVRLIVPV